MKNGRVLREGIPLSGVCRSRGLVFGFVSSSCYMPVPKFGDDSLRVEKCRAETSYTMSLRWDKDKHVYDVSKERTFRFGSKEVVGGEEAWTRPRELLWEILQARRSKT